MNENEKPRGPRVFVVHRPNGKEMSFKAAEQYGTIVTIFDGFINLEDDRVNAKQAKRVMRELEFSDDDLLLLSGAKVLNLICALAALDRFVDDSAMLKVLTFNSQKNSYQKHEFYLGAREDDDE